MNVVIDLSFRFEFYGLNALAGVLEGSLLSCVAISAPNTGGALVHRITPRNTEAGISEHALMLTKQLS
ncbi:hypothetical protein RIF29_22148 [Crotalaria pallida]|uniref:Uncharacterized protein n=1 Tax=Crotalaria pallida TaxID=3830 RepID=A0AAN9I7U1_CROPI